MAHFWNKSELSNYSISVGNIKILEISFLSTSKYFGEPSIGAILQLYRMPSKPFFVGIFGHVTSTSVCH